MTSKVSARGSGSRAAACRECGARRDDGAQISARGLCLECGITRSTEAAGQLAAGEGPYFDQWQASMRDFVRRLEPR